MVTGFNIPMIYFLIFLISKEIFSYDSEKVVILCILTFVILAYYKIRESLNETFKTQSLELEEEFLMFLNLKTKSEKNIEIFLEAFLNLEKQLVELVILVKSNFKKTIAKANKNRILFNFHIIKDQLNLFYKINLLVNYILTNLQTKSATENFNSTLETKVDYNLANLDLISFIDKLDITSDKITFYSLIGNKVKFSVKINQNIIGDLNTLLKHIIIILLTL